MFVKYLPNSKYKLQHTLMVHSAPVHGEARPIYADPDWTPVVMDSACLCPVGNPCNLNFSNLHGWICDVVGAFLAICYALYFLQANGNYFMCTWAAPIL